MADGATTSSADARDGSPRPALPPELWAEVLCRVIADDGRGSALRRTSRTLHDLGRWAWRTVRQALMLPIAAQLAADVRALRAFDVALTDELGRPWMYSAGGTLCDTRGPYAPETALGDYLRGPRKLPYRHRATRRYLRRSDSLRCEYRLWTTSVITSMAFDRPVHDVSMWINGQEVILHEGHLEAGHAVRLYARPRIALPIAWLSTELSFEATAYDDDDDPVCSVQCCMLPCPILPRPRSFVMSLRCGRTLRLDGGETAVE